MKIGFLRQNRRETTYGSLNAGTFEQAGGYGGLAHHQRFPAGVFVRREKDQFEALLAQPDAVTRPQDMPVNPAAVDPRAVAAFEVEDLKSLAFGADARVLPGDQRMAEDDFEACPPTNYDFRVGQRKYVAPFRRLTPFESGFLLRYG